jgi:ABC-type branched-subunit amino acid transport system permease subunit
VAGVFVAPYSGVIHAEMGMQFAILAFIVVVIGGMGNMSGTLFASILVYDLLLLGDTGIVSFGHVMFFGIGTYSMAIVMHKLGPTIPSLLLAVVVGADVDSRKSTSIDSRKRTAYPIAWL